MIEVSMQFDLTDADEVPSRPANLVFVQKLRGEYALMFGHAPPPAGMVMLGDAEAAEYFKANQIKVHHITRLTMPARTAAILVQALGNLMRASGDEDELRAVQEAKS